MSYANHVLSCLPPDDLELLAPDLRPVELPVRMMLEHPGKPSESVYFPACGVASAVVTAGRERPMEIGLIGGDGFVGHCILMNDERPLVMMQMCLPGHGWSIEAEVLKAHVEQSASLRIALLHSMRAFHAQIISTAWSSGQASIEERVARWLLMLHDRVAGDDLPVTHEMIALALGTRRPGVTQALRDLTLDGIIAAERCKLTIRDRGRLTGRALAFYGTAERQQFRLTGWETKGLSGGHPNGVVPPHVIAA